MPRPNQIGPKGLHRSTLEDRSLGVGDPTAPGKAVGKDRAVWAAVDLTGGGAAIGTVKEYDLAHTLKETPTSCVLESCENAAVPGTFINANAARKENWSHSHVHVSITLVAGSFDGCVARFRVSGR